jgi:predicted porin
VKKIIALSTLVTGCICMHTAQAAVTLYGLLDTSISYQTNQAAAFLPNGQASRTGSAVTTGLGFFNGSRWGLAGEEDLGGGLATVFRLESGFNLGNGTSLQGGREFGRQAYVGIKGSSWQMLFGRQYSVPFDVLLPYDTIGWGNAINSDVWVQFLAGARLDNTAKYILTLGEWRFSAAYSFGGQTGNALHGSTYSAGMTYQHNSFSTGVVAQQAQDPNGKKQSNLGAGASYVAGPVSFFGYYLYTHRDGLFAPSSGQDFAPTYGTFSQVYANPGITNSGTSTRSRTDNLFQLGVSARPLPSIQLSLAGIYDFADHVNAQDEDGKRWAVFATGDYLLSKRTDLYLVGTYNKASSSLGGVFAGANDSVGVSVGIRHRF